MNELIEHIKNINAKRLAWMNESPGRWAMTITEDPDYWAAAGITTVPQFERDQLIGIAWGMYKDIHGVRPRHVLFSEMSNDEIQGFIDRLKEENNG